jgi:RNA polymerase sigma-70 factor (ECF subfamily)
VIVSETHPHDKVGVLTQFVDPLTEAGVPSRPLEEQGQAATEGGRQQRLATLLRAHFRTIWRAVRRLGVPAGSAEDATQEVFIVLASKLAEVQPGKERAYLYAVTARVAANFRRSSIVRHEHPGDGPLFDATSPLPDAEMLLDQKRRRALLDYVLDTLTQDLRTAFVLFELEDLSVPEIAEVLHIPTGTVASRLRRAREQFEAALVRAQGRLK